MKSAKSNNNVLLWIYLSLVFLIVLIAFVISMFIFPTAEFNLSISKFSISNDSFNGLLFIQFLTVSIILNLIIIPSFKSGTLNTTTLFIIILLYINSFCFIIGVNVPLLVSTKFWFFSEKLSLIQVLTNLYDEMEYGLFYIMFVFTFLIPVLKLLILTYEVSHTNSMKEKNVILLILSKWAMLDVFIIGIIVSSFKGGGGFVEIKTANGLIFFIFSVLLTLLISTILYQIKKPSTIK